jgi:hypothetical protein
LAGKGDPGFVEAGAVQGLILHHGAEPTSTLGAPLTNQLLVVLLNLAHFQGLAALLMNALCDFATGILDEGDLCVDNSPEELSV